MIRGFLTGLVWGGVVGAAGLAVISQVAPLPAPVAAPAAPEAVPVQPAEPVATPEPAKPAPLPSPAPQAEADAPQAAPVEPVPVQPDPAEQPAFAQTDTPELTAIAPDASELFAQDDPSAEAPEGVTPAPVGTPKADAAPAGDAVAEPPSVAVEAPAAEPAAPQPADQALLMPAPEPSGLPRVAPLPAVPPLMGEAAPEMGDLPAPTPETTESAPDATAQMPRMIVPDDKPLTGAAADMPAADALPRIGDAEPVAEPVIKLATPLELFARPFENPDAKPLFSILLIDDGAPDTDRETLAALPFAVTFVIDPMLPGAAEAAAIYRNAGQEVMMQTNAVPAGATATDLEQSYQALDIALPEAVAVLGASGLAADGRELATAVVPILAAQGRGIVTMDRGLNAVDQAARREGVPQATIFRLLDASGESVPVIRRYLDRAAFRAAQEGSVVVLGSTRPDTIAAILQWTVEGRAASVALAPVSAVLTEGE